MKKRLASLVMVVVLLLSCNSSVLACDEEQTNIYVTQILFGDRADSRASDENVRMLMAALYLCSEQADNQGQDKISYLKQHKVSGVPALNKINITNDQLIECSHKYWEYEYPAAKNIRANRQKVLRNTVNKVFDFGFFNNVFGSNQGKCDSFSAFLYYSHILADYLEDVPNDTEVSVNGGSVPIYTDQDYAIINNDIPTFTEAEIARAKSGTFIDYSPLDSHGRAGVVTACIGPDTIDSVGDRANMSGIKPSGWRFDTYPGIVNSQPAYLYNRCHLLAHSLGGKDKEDNLVTGTRYMNEIMAREVENKVKEDIDSTKQNVLYRATPIYKGSNALCSGIQLEVYYLDDTGEGKHFNRFFYNVQPQIAIDYSTGDNYFSDESKYLPFAVINPSDNNRDLIYEMNKHLAIIFDDQKESGVYIAMMNDLNAIANEARTALNSGGSDTEIRKILDKCQYEYFEALKTYVPRLLENEDFFSKTFK